MLTLRAASVAALCLTLAAVTPAAADRSGDGIQHDFCFGGASFCVGAGTRPSAPSGSDASTTHGNSKGRPSKPHKADPSEATDCTMKRMDPQPPPDSIAYRGEGKIVYERTCGDGVTGWVGVDPGADAPTVDPAVVAQQAVDSMKLVGPKVASPSADGRYVVGVPMWMWVTPSATTFGPNTAKASAGGVTVTATAKVSKVVWSMGDGEKVICDGPGTPFTNKRRSVESPDCGHRYQEPSTQEDGRKYHLKATAYWNVTWQASTGEEGQLPTTRESDVAFTVGELQAVGS